MKNALLILVLILTAMFFAGCEKDEEIPPEINFKTGSGYTLSDAIVSPDTSLTVGVIVEKKEDDLKKYNVSVAYDGSATTTTVEEFTIPDSQYSHYEKDVTFSVRSIAGTEQYFFTVTDSDGNIAQLTLTLTVQ